MYIFFSKKKTAYKMRISDWSSGVCSSDLHQIRRALLGLAQGFTLILKQGEAEPGVQFRVIHPIALQRARAIMLDQVVIGRSEERRVGKECVSTCRSRWSPYTKKNSTTY